MVSQTSDNLKSCPCCQTRKPLPSNSSRHNLQALQRVRGTRPQLPNRLLRQLAAFLQCRRLCLQQLPVILLLHKLKPRTSMLLCPPQHPSQDPNSHSPLELPVHWLSTISLLLLRCHRRLSVQSRISLPLQYAKCPVLPTGSRPRHDETATLWTKVFLSPTHRLLAPILTLL
jgi:hypothetical protein